MVTDETAKAYLGDDGFIWQVYHGDQTVEGVEKVATETEQAIQKLQNEGKPILIMADIRDFGKPDLGARQLGGKVLRTWPYKKLAAFGAKAFLSSVINLMLLAISHQNNVRLFRTEDEARRWLNEP